MSKITGKLKLDAYEQDIVDHLSEKKEETYTKKIKNDKLSLYKDAAEAYLKKGKRISIRVYESDFGSLKKIAAKKGLPYQTLVTSVLHQYATGQFEEHA